MSEIEHRVRSEVCRVVANASNWPTPVSAQLLGRDLSEPIDMLVEAIIPIIQEAKAEALTDIAGQMRDRFTAAWIRGKANEIINGPRKIVGAFAKPVESEADCGDQDL